MKFENTTKRLSSHTVTFLYVLKFNNKVLERKKKTVSI